jgi:hypothetical protein
VNIHLKFRSKSTAISPTNLNLDDMFSFLVQEENSLNKSSNTVLDDIYKQFEDLGEQLEEDMVRLELFVTQSLHS